MRVYSGDLEGQMVVVGSLPHHCDVVDALRPERQLCADALSPGAAGALDFQRRLVEVEERHRPASSERLCVVAMIWPSADVEPVATRVAHGDDEWGFVRCGRRRARC